MNNTIGELFTELSLDQAVGITLDSRKGLFNSLKGKRRGNVPKSGKQAL